MMIIASPAEMDLWKADIFRFSDVEGPLAARAEAMVEATRRKSWRHRRGGRSWTGDDEALFRARLGELYEARAKLIRLEA